MGIDGVFLMSGYAAEAALLDALSEAHVVLLSSSSAPLGKSGNAVAAYHLKSEQAVQASGLPGPFFAPAPSSPTCCVGATNSMLGTSYARRSATPRRP